jgi:hypothetical protein
VNTIHRTMVYPPHPYGPFLFSIFYKFKQSNLRHFDQLFHLIGYYVSITATLTASACGKILYCNNYGDIEDQNEDNGR